MRYVPGLCLLAVTASLSVQADAQNSAQRVPVQLTAEQDHKRLMDLLKISGFPPGAVASSPDTYNEALANPYPNLPDPLTFKDGHPGARPLAFALLAGLTLAASPLAFLLLPSCSPGSGLPRRGAESLAPGHARRRRRVRGRALAGLPDQRPLPVLDRRARRRLRLLWARVLLPGASSGARSCSRLRGLLASPARRSSSSRPRSERTSPVCASPRSRSRAALSLRAWRPLPSALVASRSRSRGTCRRWSAATSARGRPAAHAALLGPAIVFPARRPDAVVPRRGRRHRRPLGRGLPRRGPGSRSCADGSARTTSRRTSCCTTTSGRRVPRAGCAGSASATSC